MKLLNKGLLRDFEKKHSDIKPDLDSWEAHVQDQTWKSPHDVKEQYPKASILGAQRIVFNIQGNRYRLLVTISYKNEIIMINKIGTHKEYDKWKL